MKLKRFNLNTSFVRVLFLNGFSSGVKIFTSFITTKLVASIIGPSGIALVGQLSNFLGIIFAFSSGGINAGVVKYSAENKEQLKLMRFFLSTSCWITLTFSITIGIFTLLFGNFLSIKILYSGDYTVVFWVISICILLYAFNSIFLSIINGLKEFKNYTYINVISSILSLIITVLMVYFFNIRGALIALVVSQSCVAAITFFFVKDAYWFRLNTLFGYFKWRIASKLFKYSLMAIVTAIFVPTTQFLIRSYIITNFSIESAGIWEGMNKTSNMYLVIITTTLGVYFLPKFSEAMDDHKLRTEIFTAYKFVLPALIVGCLFIYFSRDLIIRIVFSPAFILMRELFIFQLPGDILKMMTWILGTVMVSKAMYKQYIAFEIITNTLLYFLAVAFSQSLGLRGVCLGYVVAMLLTLTIMAIVFRKLLFKTGKP